LSTCFEEAEPPAPPPPAVIVQEPVGGTAIVAAPAPVVALLEIDRTAGPAPAPMAVVSPASPAAVADLGFTPRNGIAVGSHGFVAEECACSTTGIIRGVNTGQPGCAKHQKEPGAYVEGYCYVEGDFACGGAMRSDIFEGLFWVNCEKPNLHLLYPPTCEIIERSTAKLFDIPMNLGLEVPPSSFENSTRNMAPLPTEGSPLEDMRAGLSSWSEPMPPLWHAAHGNYFSDGEFQKGPFLPAGKTQIVAGPAAAVAASPAAAAPMAPAAALLEQAGKLRGVRQH